MIGDMGYRTSPTIAEEVRAELMPLAEEYPAWLEQNNGNPGATFQDFLDTHSHLYDPSSQSGVYVADPSARLSDKDLYYSRD